jgi:hypothetical protein
MYPAIIPVTSSIVTVEGNTFVHKSTAKVEGVTGHTVITEFNGDKVTRWALRREEEQGGGWPAIVYYQTLRGFYGRTSLTAAAQIFQPLHDLFLDSVETTNNLEVPHASQANRFI